MKRVYAWSLMLKPDGPIMPFAEATRKQMVEVLKDYYQDYPWAVGDFQIVRVEIVLAKKPKAKRRKA